MNSSIVYTVDMADILVFGILVHMVLHLAVLSRYFVLYVNTIFFIQL